MADKTIPLVTIAIPTYNRANGYLRNAIECALRQTYQNVEIVVSDNCSSDNTEDVVKGFSDQRVRYFRQQVNIGANNNFNFCLERANGKYLLLLHDDDLIDDDFIEVCMGAAGYDTNVGIIRTGTRLIDSGGEVIAEFPNRSGGLSSEDFFLSWFDCKTSLYLCSTLFNRKRLGEIGGFRSKHNLFQDVAAEAKLAVLFGRIDIRDVKASFRKHFEELTFAAKVGDWCEDSLELLDLMCDLLPAGKEAIRARGMQFLAGLNYNRARGVKTFRKSLAAYFIVFRKFGYRHFPPKYHFIDPLYDMLKDTRAYSGIRFLKRKAKRAVDSMS